MSQRWLNHIHPGHVMLLSNYLEQLRLGVDPKALLAVPIPDAQNPSQNSSYMVELQEMAGAINSTGRLIDDETGGPPVFKLSEVVIDSEGKFSFAPEGMKLDTIYWARLPVDTTGISFATDSGSGFLLGGIASTAGNPETYPPGTYSSGTGATNPVLPGKAGEIFSMRLYQGGETFKAHGSMTLPGAKSKQK